MATIDYERKVLISEWCVDDIQAVREDLTEEQAFTVLEAVADRFKAEIGINWMVIEWIAHDLFAEEEDDEI